MLLSQTVTLSDSTSTSEGRRASARMAALLGFNETKAGEAALIVTEATRNAIVYGGGGQLVLAGTKSPEVRLDILVIDRGPGISDLPRALTDGYSTGGTPGTGLGAIRRMADVFDVFTSPKGTVLYACVMQTGMPPQKDLLDLAGLAVPIQTEIVCGDGIAWDFQGDRCVVLNIDGLGHGVQAAEAAEEGVRIFQAYSQEPPASIVTRLHDALKKTRGAAAAVAEIRPLAGSLVYAGVGNISASILSNTSSRSLISYNGTLGHVMAKVQEFKVEWPKDGMLIMHSDGLQTRWDLSRYPGLMRRQPALIAGVLLRDFRRDRDDTSVLVVRGRDGGLK